MVTLECIDQYKSVVVNPWHGCHALPGSAREVADSRHCGLPVLCYKCLLVAKTHIIRCQKYTLKWTVIYYRTWVMVFVLLTKRGHKIDRCRARDSSESSPMNAKLSK